MFKATSYLQEKNLSCTFCLHVMAAAVTEYRNARGRNTQGQSGLCENVSQKHKQKTGSLSSCWSLPCYRTEGQEDLAGVFWGVQAPQFTPKGGGA